MKIRWFFLLALTFIFSWSALAQAESIRSNSFELGVFGGKGLYDSYGVNRIEGPWIIGARVGYFPIKYLSLEPSYQYAFTGTQPFSGNLQDANIQSARFNVLLNLMPDSVFVPFVTAGVGWERFHVDTAGNSNDLGINAGAGFRIFLVENLAIRADGRYVTVDFAGARQHNYEITGGLSFFFGGGAPAPEPTPTPEPEVKDADGDGIENSKDECPGSRKGIQVDEKGCSIDGDGDGVPNHMDKCLETPKGSKIDEWGCQVVDTDGDGVRDKIDLCADTEKGVKVDIKGCPVKTKSRGVLEGVTFRSGKDELTPNSETILKDVANELLEFPKVRVEVQGHTDSTGPEAFNYELSKKRAQAVVEFLVSQGVKRNRLEAMGYGETKPIATNGTPDGRAQNRRVELNWLD